MLISLIIPTIHRVRELDIFFEHLQTQRLDPFNFQDIEVIVVDQNPDNRLAPLIDKYSHFFSIHHLKAEAKGQSAAKNIGLEIARGKFLGFPDDDCYYTPNLLAGVLKTLVAGTGNEAIVCRSYDPKSGLYNFKYPKKYFSIKHPKDPKILFGIQFCQFYPASIARDIKFDIDLCSGGKWGSGEETDQMVEFLKRGGIMKFCPELIVHHPFPGHFKIPTQKLVHYAKGFGALCRKQKLYRILFQRSVKLFAGTIYFFLTARWTKSLVCFQVFYHRLRGYFIYQPNHSTH